MHELPAQERSVGRAYALGYVCHYLLDSTVHPLVISQVNALCAAGVEGLAAEDAHEVHAVIETELDELVLTAKRGETVATYHPATSVLRGRDSMLDTVGRLYATAIDDAFGLTMPKGMFKSAVRAERAAQRALYSPTGAKRAVLSAGRLVPSHDRGQAWAAERALPPSPTTTPLAPSSRGPNQPRQLLGSVRPGAQAPGRH
ncbi:MAG: zinc dependent phospholipase C family protein [Adlercreutzia equolifaciens]